MRITENRSSNPTAALLTAAFCLFTAAGAATGEPASPAAAPEQDQRQPTERMQQHEFGVAPGGTLRVRVDDADVAVRTTSDATAHVDISLTSNEMPWARAEFEKMDFRARLDGDTVIVESDRRNDDSWRRGRWMSVLVEVRVPERFDLDVETKDGDLGVQAHSGRARLRSQDGDLTIGSLEGADINLWSQDGDIMAEDLRGGTITIETQDGDVLVHSIEGNVSIDTQDGDVRIASATTDRMTAASGDGDLEVGIAEPGNIELDTNDGDISIFAPASLRATVDFSGDEVEIDGGFTIDGRITSGKTEGLINGGGNEIRARAGDGTIRLVAQN